MFDTNWADVPKDTPIYVRNSVNDTWIRAHFAKYKNGLVYAWDLGHTSHTAYNDKNRMSAWKYAKLY